jgi:hypothetical protein
MIILIPRITSDRKEEGVPKDVPVVDQEANGGRCAACSAGAVVGTTSDGGIGMDMCGLW